MSDGCDEWQKPVGPPPDTDGSYGHCFHLTTKVRDWDIAIEICKGWATYGK